MPDSIEKVKNSSFESCKKLKKIVLGKNVNEFTNSAIYNSGVEKIEVDESNSNYSVRSGAKCNGEVVEALYNKDGSVFISPIKMLGTIETYEIPASVVEGINVKKY